jgi:hypothetical protein
MVLPWIYFILLAVRIRRFEALSCEEQKTVVILLSDRIVALLVLLISFCNVTEKWPESFTNLIASSKVLTSQPNTLFTPFN